MNTKHEESHVNAGIRDTNRRSITGLLYRAGPCSQQEICSQLGLSLPTVSGILRELEAQDNIVESTAEHSVSGRRPRLYALNADHFRLSSVDLAPDGYSIMIANIRKALISVEHYDTPFSDDRSYWKELFSRLWKQAADAGIPKYGLLNTVILFPGAVDPGKELAEVSPGLTISTDTLSKYASPPGYFIFVNRSINAAAYTCAERFSLSSYVYLDVGEEIQGVISIRRIVLPGANYMSARFGHITIVPDGKECSCGCCGCLNAYCSTSVLKKGSARSLSSFFRSAAEVPWERERLTVYLSHLADGLANIINMLDLPVIIGGELAESMDDASRVRLQELTRMRLCRPLEKDMILYSVRPEHAALTGGIQMGIDRFLSRQKKNK